MTFIIIRNWELGLYHASSNTHLRITLEILF
jgi:hypothetical protein